MAPPSEKETKLGIGDFVKKAKDLAAGNKDKVEQGIDKAADMVDEKTGGKYSRQVETGTEKAKDFLENLDND